MSATEQAAASLFLDLEGLCVSTEERELMDHPVVGGVILFSRNVEDYGQLQELVHEIRDASPDIVIAVDQEGGRVQRFRNGFSELPPPAVLGQLWGEDQAAALRSAEVLGWLMASEVQGAGVDLSFAPVLDLDFGRSGVIGDRALHGQPSVVAELGSAWVRGMHGAGMAATGKHFPGHGYVAEDSHLDLPVDHRSLQEIRDQDLAPFTTLVAGGIDAIMPAHVVYPAVDDQPAGFSRRWLQDILRTELGFSGLILSDDLGMAGAAVAGGYAERASAALQAGCDVLLVCNDRTGACCVLEQLASRAQPLQRPLYPLRMRGKTGQPDTARRSAALHTCEALNQHWQQHCA